MPRSSLHGDTDFTADAEREMAVAAAGVFAILAAGSAAAGVVVVVVVVILAVGPFALAEDVAAGVRDDFDDVDAATTTTGAGDSETATAAGAGERGTAADVVVDVADEALRKSK